MEKPKSEIMKSIATPPGNRGVMPKALDAIALLRADHKLVSALFADYEKTQSTTRKKKLVSQICTELAVQAQAEEEVFYPAVKRALKDKLLIPEAIVQQATMSARIGQVQGVELDGEMCNAKVRVLCDYVKPHVKEEHTKMLPKAKATSPDMMVLGAATAARKAEILVQRPVYVTLCPRLEALC